MGLNGSSAGVSYQLYNGAAADGTAVTGTGAAISFGMQTAGTYTVIATNLVTGCKNTMTGNAVISVTAAPNTTFNYSSYNYCPTGSAVATLAGSPATGMFSATPAGLNFSNPSTGAINLAGSLPGTYSIKYIVAAAGGCAAYTYTQPNTLLVTALPAIFGVTGGGAYCSGGSGLNVNLNGSTTGVNYQLYNGAATAGAAVAGTGAAISFGLKTAAGTYTVTATNASSGCKINMTGSAVISVTPAPNTTFTYPAYTYCATLTSAAAALSGSPASGTFSASPSGLNFSNVSSGVINLGTCNAGTYSIKYTVAASGGCPVYTYTQTTKISINAVPNLFTVTGGGPYCITGSGAPVGLSNSQTGVNYQLYRSATAIGLPVAGTGSSISFGNQLLAGTYTVTAKKVSSPFCSIQMTGSAVITISTSSFTHNNYPGKCYCL